MIRRLTELAAMLLIAISIGCHPSPPTTTPHVEPTHNQTSDGSDLPTPEVSQPSITPTPVRTAMPTLIPTITPTPIPWTHLASGIDQQFIPVWNENLQSTFYVYALRIDPAKVTFRVEYEQGQAKTIEEWQAATGAQIVLNGGFFSGNYTPVGRIVSNGVLYGFPLNYGEKTIGVSGLFTVLDGDPALYALGRSSYSPRGMRFDEAIESYPILLLPGRQPTYPTETGERARRTVIGLDDQNRVIVLVCDVPIFSLHELSGWLTQVDLNMDTALNLDGGRSTGLVAVSANGYTDIPAYVPLPIVLAIYSD